MSNSCNPVDCSPPGFAVHGILQARILEWVAIFCSRRLSRPRDWTCVSCIAGRLFTFKPPGKPNRNLKRILNISEWIRWYMTLSVCESRCIRYKAAVSKLSGTRDWFHRRQFFHGLGDGRTGGGHALHFYFYDIVIYNEILIQHITQQNRIIRH